MQKLSQKELLEGFGSNLMKSVGRGIAGAAKTAAKMISPTAVDVAKKAGDKVGGAIANIAYGSPKAALQEYFNRPEVKSKYKDFQVDSSKDINKMRKKLVISVTDVKTNKKVTGEVEAYRTDSGGMAAETWGFDKFKLSNGDVINSGTSAEARQSIQRSREGIDRMRGTLQNLDGKPQAQEGDQGEAPDQSQAQEEPAQEPQAQEEPQSQEEPVQQPQAQSQQGNRRKPRELTPGQQRARQRLQNYRNKKQEEPAQEEPQAQKEPVQEPAPAAEKPIRPVATERVPFVSVAKPGDPHPKNPNIVFVKRALEGAPQGDGEFEPAEGYEWVDADDPTNHDVKPKDNINTPEDTAPKVDDTENIDGTLPTTKEEPQSQPDLQQQIIQQQLDELESEINSTNDPDEITILNIQKNKLQDKLSSLQPQEDEEKSQKSLLKHLHSLAR